MDYHKKEWEEKPVVLEKPRRGREMVTTDVPKDLLDTMRMMTAKQQLRGEKGVKTALEAEREGDVELYHEGWVDGKKYLVPDSNLEIMKDLVNLKIRRKGDSVFVKKKDYEASRLDTEQKYKTRMRALSEKIDELERAKLLKKKSMYKTSEARSAEESTGSSASRRKPFEIVPVTDESTTFLISGHIRERYNPLFIIQKYKGKSPFGRKRSDFSQVKSSRNVDILISGNFFRRSVLEEKLNSIEGIRLKWNLLVPVDKRSLLYETRFSEHFDIQGIDIVFEGDFIKERGLLNYTPILTFLVPKPPSSRLRGRRRADNIKNWKMCKSISSILSRREVSTYNVQIENKPSMKSTTDDFTSRENSGIESSVEELGGRWSSTEDELSGKEQTKGRDRKSGYSTDKEVLNDNEFCKIHLVVVPSKNGKRSVAGGSSTVKLPEDISNTTVLVNEEANQTERDGRRRDDDETVVVFAPKDELWSPFRGVEPDLRSCSSHSTWEDCTCDDKESNDQGDADRSTTANKSEESLRKNKSRGILHDVDGLRPKNLHASENKLVDRNLSRNELTEKDPLRSCETLEYKCQVRPSKRRSQRNCLLRKISKLFSK